MDTSDEYIKMCDCPEMQEIKPKGFDAVGSFFTFFETGMGFTIHGRHTGVYFGEKNLITDFPKSSCIQMKDFDKDAIWLPRQDQLQEMIDLTDNTAVDLFIICNFYGFCQAWNKEFSTMEQLWLAFVMSEKFNKHWNGKRWNNIGGEI